eukprot:TRINITY_DN21198_c0_g3_i1.p1 TRINITY_DN21198_c0_g3~~TRINITY_DN21198_c0_g3_i1.p1  ORF type:complete len:374 (+),score=44.59 TRINITY_DN21198_c0_g3_i1:50-1171(+)
MDNIVLFPVQLSVFFLLFASLPQIDAKSRKCQDKDPQCRAWADGGECEANPGYMLVSCRKSCGNCEAPPSECNDKRKDCRYITRRGACLLNTTVLELCPSACRVCGPGDPCRPDTSSPAFAAPGDLDKFFANLPTDPELASYEPKLMTEHPWPVVFDNFLTSEEVDDILALFTSGWMRSQAGGIIGEESSMSARTSEQIWCSSRECLNSKAMRKLIRKAESVTGISSANFEDTQVLRYLPGQQYTQHSDFIDEQNRLACGPRVLTLFVYLSDSPEAGTAFPALNVTVPAKRGRAALWPDVTSKNVYRHEPLTEHAGLPPASAATTKYAANIWIHQYRFRHYNQMHCLLADRPLKFIPAKQDEAQAHTKSTEEL